MVRPLFDDSFTIAAGNTHHRVTEPLPVRGSNLLQCLTGIWYHQETCLRHRFNLGLTLHHETAYAAIIEFGDKIVPVAALAGQGKKYGVLRKYQFPAVDQQVLNTGLRHPGD